MRNGHRPCRIRKAPLLPRNGTCAVSKAHYGQVKHRASKKASESLVVGCMKNKIQTVIKSKIQPVNTDAVVKVSQKLDDKSLEIAPVGNYFLSSLKIKRILIE